MIAILTTDSQGWRHLRIQFVNKRVAGDNVDRTHPFWYETLVLKTRPLHWDRHQTRQVLIWGPGKFWGSSKSTTTMTKITIRMRMKMMMLNVRMYRKPVPKEKEGKTRGGVPRKPVAHPGSVPFRFVFFSGWLFQVDLVFFIENSLSQNIFSYHWKHLYWLFCLSKEVNFDNKIHNSSCDWWSPRKRLFICVPPLGKSGIWHQEGYICSRLQNSCCGYWSPQSCSLLIFVALISAYMGSPLPHQTSSWRNQYFWSCLVLCLIYMLKCQAFFPGFQEQET